MSKAYSNRALPAGTVLREWRLEEVLGVGGFGIVYKGCGIYFNELVAIKEYFPSSISERGEDDTVVPIDSDAEEVHALGLKKFVEEAKLLWNLSTPTRHPNIVSVRSLFEIHGTAYMVMDFEDGTPLSRILKKGRRFNEASLRSIILPIAEGLERAHRVGVLHRDIKPPNIIINDDGRSVLIDFGSARFESGDATSTKVTFHTPPYAAIEQYVRTFPQGPWTDIYALGVLLYECITGEKPAEVLERMHGDAGTLLATGAWPGFSRGFLAAVDRAMAVRPEDRPQSISEWLALLDVEPADETDDDDAAETRVGSWDTTSATILPVAPTKDGFVAPDHKIETGVPDTPSKAEFDKRTDAKRIATTPADRPPAAKSKPAKPPEAAAKPAETPPAEKPAPAAKVEEVRAKPTPAPDKPAKGGIPTKAIAGGVAVAAMIAVGGWALSGDSGTDQTAAPVDPVAIVEDLSGVPTTEIDAATVDELVEDARSAGMPRDLLALLQSPSDEAGGDGRTGASTTSIATLAKFGLATVERAKSLTSSGVGPKRRNSQTAKAELAKLENFAAAIKISEEPDAAVASTRELIGSYRRLSSHFVASKPTPKPSDAVTPRPDATLAARPVPVVVAQPSAAPSVSTAAGVSERNRREFASALSGARSVARQVIQLGDRNRPGSNASEQDKQAYSVRQGAAKAARDYEKYLDGLNASMGGNISDADAVQSIAKANQTRAYLTDLLKRSQLTLR